MTDNSQGKSANGDSNWVKVRYRVGQHELEVEGSNELVEKHRAYFFQEVVGGDKQQEVGEQRVETMQDALPQGSQEMSKASQADMSLLKFFMEKSPQRQADEVMVIAYYYHHYRNQEFLSLEDFDKAYDELKRAGVDKPANMKSSVRNVVDRTNYMYNPDRGLFQLTIQGEKYVEKYDSNATNE